MCGAKQATMIYFFQHFLLWIALFVSHRVNAHLQIILSMFLLCRFSVGVYFQHSQTASQSKPKHQTALRVLL